MVKHDRVIDYIIEQADRYDGNNLQFEQDILFRLQKCTDRMISNVLSTVKTDITNVLYISSLMLRITDIMNGYVSSCKKILLDMFNDYYDTAYDQMGDLIQLGNEVSTKMNEGVREQRSNKEYDEDTIEYIQQHAFELLKGHSNEKIEKIRSKIGDMFLRGTASKSAVRSAIESILEVNRSKAEEIAQTELSRAYNYGSVDRFKQYSALTGERVRKYWHGFKYSERTCEYCRPRIGLTFDIDDDSEVLPAHVRCRCVWLPILDGWDEPVNKSLISRANMINTIYNKDMMYQRINNRLGINYAEYMDQEAMVDYLAGDRTEKVGDALNYARIQYINDKKNSFDIAKEKANTHMANEFNQQMDFWKKYVAGAMADNDKEVLNNSYEAIKAIMVLPWSATQLDGWNTLLGYISNFK